MVTPKLNLVEKFAENESGVPSGVKIYDAIFLISKYTFKTNLLSYF